jgi:cold shock CspA family protein
MTASEEVSHQPIPTNEGDTLAESFRYYFERSGAEVELDEDYQEDYLLDFIVTELENVHAHVNLGVHVTSEEDDLDQQKTFMKASDRGVVLKSIYVELSDATSDSGGLLIAFGACLSFLFDQRYSQVDSIGIRVEENCSFNFFDLEENIERLERMSMDEDLTVGEDLAGRIIAYFTEKGFGFIQTDEERKFFFHIANVVDDDLRARLPSYVPGETIDVAFQYGGHDGKKYPKAINVSLDPEEREHSEES